MTAPHSILLCPFCGGEAVASVYGRDLLYKVECKECYGSVRGFDQCQQDANAAWNTRTPTLLSGEVEAWTDDKLNGWARNWHWQDTAEDKPVDPSIYFRDRRMLKAFLAALSPQPQPRKTLDEFKDFLTDLADLNTDEPAQTALLAAGEYIAEDNNPKSNRVLALIREALSQETTPTDRTPPFSRWADTIEAASLAIGPKGSEALNALAAEVRTYDKS